jgi:uncharacterized membrane-anchored protein
MTLHTVAGPAGSGEPADRPGESPLSYAIRAIGTLVSESPLAHEQFREARHDLADTGRLDTEAARAGQHSADAQARAAAERHKASPHKRINRRLGTGLAVGLALLDALPAYWSAEAFGLGQDSTLVLTVLLCAALGGAMWLLDLFDSKGRRGALRILAAALGAGFVTLFVLRLEYLQVTGGGNVWSSAIEAFALTAISAALVAVGFVLLSHRTPPSVASAERLARGAANSGTVQAAASARAKAAMSRAAFEDTVVTWALSRQPADIGHEQFLDAIGQAIGILLGSQETAGRQR